VFYDRNAVRVESEVTRVASLFIELISVLISFNSPRAVLNCRTRIGLPGVVPSSSRELTSVTVR
jgi:hypothetical protein